MSFFIIIGKFGLYYKYYKYNLKGINNKMKELINPHKKTLAIIGVICSIVIIILAGLNLFGIAKNVSNIMQPFLGILVSVQLIQYWRKNRLISIIGITCFIICLICAIMVIGFAILG